MASVETDEVSDEEYEYVFTVNHQEKRKPPICQLQINGKSMEMMIDLGASVNLLDEITFTRIKSHHNESLRPTHTKIHSYGSGTPLPLLVTLNATVKSSYASTSAQLLVVKGENDSSQSQGKHSQSDNHHYGDKPGKYSRKCGNCGGYAPHKNPCPA